MPATLRACGMARQPFAQHHFVAIGLHAPTLFRTTCSSTTLLPLPQQLYTVKTYLATATPGKINSTWRLAM